MLFRIILIRTHKNVFQRDFPCVYGNNVDRFGFSTAHSFASYHLAHFKNAASTALELGHHDSRITFAYYRELVKPKDAERYWNIRPTTKEKIVPLVARA